jgi:hypothetical protein
MNKVITVLLTIVFLQNSVHAADKDQDRICKR